jgi:diacylglycerol kinase family enzyme
LKKRFGALAYVWACVQTMGDRRPCVVAELGCERIPAALVCVGNGRYLGGRFPLFPHARPDDGLIDVAVFPRVGWTTVARVFLRLLTDTVGRSSCGVHRQVRSLRLTGDAGLPLQVEGDNVGTVPACFGLEPGGLRVAVPARR